MVGLAYCSSIPLLGDPLWAQARRLIVTWHSLLQRPFTQTNIPFTQTNIPFMETKVHTTCQNEMTSGTYEADRTFLAAGGIECEIHFLSLYYTRLYIEMTNNWTSSCWSFQHQRATTPLSQRRSCEGQEKAWANQIHPPRKLGQHIYWKVENSKLRLFCRKTVPQVEVLWKSCKSCQHTWRVNPKM